MLASAAALGAAAAPGAAGGSAEAFGVAAWARALTPTVEASRHMRVKERFIGMRNSFKIV
jgi:hypothetical protein